MKTVNGLDTGPQTLGTKLFYIPSVLRQKSFYFECHSGLTKPAPYLIRGNPVFPGWIPAPRLRGDKFTPAKAGAGMTASELM